MLGNAVWNTGASTTISQIVSKFYTEERGIKNGKICSSGDYCNDAIDRTATSTGKVGLMYPSDYGYATSGGSTRDRATCLNTNLGSWGSSGLSDCKNNDWLYNSKRTRFTISPRASSSSALGVFSMYYNGQVVYYDAYTYSDVLPAVYLKHNVKISSGTGTESDPFTLSL